MALSRRTLTLALAITPGIGSKTITRILTRNDLFGLSPDDFMKLGAEALQEEHKLKKSVAHAWAANPAKWVKEAQELEKKLEPHGVTIASAADAHYPREIEFMDSDPPGLLYFFGNRQLLESKTFCVLCSREASEAKLAEIEVLTESRVLNGEILVSGHDTPEYRRSAVTALRWGSPRIMVFDTGFYDALGPELKSEPFPTARLWRYEFDARTDLAVSFVHPDMPFYGRNNRIRDRLLASLAKQVDIVEARPGGNMERLAKMALRAGRPVRVSPDSECRERLLMLGAKLIE